MTRKENKITQIAHNLVQNKHGAPHTNEHNHMSYAPESAINKASTILDMFITQAKISQKMIANNRPANRYELIEIEALIFYTARLAEMSEEDLRHQICIELKIPTLSELSLSDYTRVREQLWVQAQNYE